MIDAATTRKIARLARIGLAPGEDESFAKELSGVMQWIEQLGEVDTKGVPALASVSDLALPWREDVVSDGHQQAAVLANAPAASYGCFAVPKVIE